MIPSKRRKQYQAAVAMMILEGKPISQGYASGIAVVLEPNVESMPRRSILPAQVAVEIERFRSAVAHSRSELEEIRQRVLHELGKSHSGIFDAHLVILHDPRFVNGVQQRIERELVNAEQALDSEVAALADILVQGGNPYLRERRQDFYDIRRRILGHLVNAPVRTATDLPPRAVLVARELMPSETLNLDRRNLAAVVTEEGGDTSHAAILARALGVPAVTAIDRLLQHVRPGTELLVDGQMGRVVVAPSAAQAISFSRDVRLWQQEDQQTVSEEVLSCTTIDGASISLLGNVARPEEAQHVIAHRLDGIGLLRTEFLFLDAAAPPSVEFQFDVYRQIADAVTGKPIVIRTLDMAADKRPLFLGPQFDHPLLAFRGLRFSLKEGKLFLTQVTAAVRLAKIRDIRLLLPMVLDPQDVVRAVEIIRDCAAKEGLSRPPMVGAMIETPAAVALLDRLAESVDFVSAGTNDLVQYMLAADRQSVDMDDDYSVLHPAVLRTLSELIARTLDTGLPISVCGEAAGDPQKACLLVGLGVRQLSMSPLRAARVRHALRSFPLAHLKGVAERALRCRTTGEARDLLAREFGNDSARFAGAPAIGERNSGTIEQRNLPRLPDHQ